MGEQTARVRVATQLRFLLPARHRHGDIVVAVDGVASLGHLVESLGVPRTEVGELRIGEQAVPANARARPGTIVDVLPAPRPQPVPAYRFLLDVHLGTLARRMRLLGLDTAYSNDATDPELAAWSVDEGRVLLTQDRGLLRRRALAAGAYVRGNRPDDQLTDVLDRFRPPLAPWTRCPACNGELEQVSKDEVLHLLEAGTRRSYTEFSRCRACGRPYWRGAHAEGLTAVVDRALVQPS